MTNLDRFSRPLASERVDPYFMQVAIQEQRELNKRNIVDSFLLDHWNVFGMLPDAETVQETFYKMDLDLDMIEERIGKF